MKFELIDAAALTLVSAAQARNAPLVNIFEDLHPGQSAEEVAEALLLAAAEIEVAETRAW